MGAEESLKLFDGADLGEGKSLRFPLPRLGPSLREGFAVRLAGGAVRAYLNVCPHRGQPVDLGDGQLFTAGGAIECQAHGALFDPATGRCVSGPCFGRALSPLEVEEHAGVFFLRDRVDDPE